jgi:hypothetical protein
LPAAASPPRTLRATPFPYNFHRRCPEPSRYHRAHCRTSHAHPPARSFRPRRPGSFTSLPAHAHSTANYSRFRCADCSSGLPAHAHSTANYSRFRSTDCCRSFSTTQPSPSAYPFSPHRADCCSSLPAHAHFLCALSRVRRPDCHRRSTNHASPSSNRSRLRRPDYSTSLPAHARSFSAFSRVRRPDCRRRSTDHANLSTNRSRPRRPDCSTSPPAHAHPTLKSFCFRWADCSRSRTTTQTNHSRPRRPDCRASPLAHAHPPSASFRLRCADCRRSRTTTQTTRPRPRRADCRTSPLAHAHSYATSCRFRRADPSHRRRLRQLLHIPRLLLAQPLLSQPPHVPLVPIGRLLSQALQPRLTHQPLNLAVTYRFRSLGVGSAAHQQARRRRNLGPAALPLDPPSPYSYSVSSGPLAPYFQTIGDVADLGVPENTLTKDDLSWRRWERYCIIAVTTPWRMDRAAHSGADAAGFDRESRLLCGFLLWCYNDIQPRSKSDPAPKPESAYAMASGVRHVHRCQNVDMVFCKQLSAVLKGLTKAFVMEHGAEALLPQRREPLGPELLRRLLAGDPATRHGAKLGSGNSICLLPCLFASAPCSRSAAAPAFASPKSRFLPAWLSTTAASAALRSSGLSVASFTPTPRASVCCLWYRAGTSS